MRPVRSFGAAVLAVALGSCANGAILELELELPPIPDDLRGHAFMEVLSAETIEAGDFDGAWDGPAIADGFTLGPTGTSERLSLVATEASISRMLGVRVRFCFDSRCDSVQDRLAPREARWVFERPLYLGRRTRYRLVVESVPDTPPAAPTEVSRCEIGHGCVAGTSFDDATYCYPDGRHFCE